jgi:hypothetical protein
LSSMGVLIPPFLCPIIQNTVYSLSTDRVLIPPFHCPIIQNTVYSLSTDRVLIPPFHCPIIQNTVYSLSTYRRCDSSLPYVQSARPPVLASPHLIACPQTETVQSDIQKLFGKVYGERLLETPTRRWQQWRTNKQKSDVVEKLLEAPPPQKKQNMYPLFNKNQAA